MKPILILISLCCMGLGAVARNFSDTVIVDFKRSFFHDKIIAEQKLIDRADGKQDGILHGSNNDEINMQLTDVLFRKIKLLREWVDTTGEIKSNNEKVRYLGYIEDMLKTFRLTWRAKGINALEFPVVVENFDNILKSQIGSKSILPFINDASYQVAKLNTAVFFDNKENARAQDIVYLKYCALNPDKILQSIRPYAKEPFADSLIVIACRNNPVQLYSYAQNRSSVEGKLILRNSDPTVAAVAKLSQTPNALFYFPFLDNLLANKMTIGELKKFVGDGEKGYDSVGYYKLLVKTEIEYFKRVSAPQPDTPIAMFGANGLHDMLKRKALEHFVTPINALHDLSNVNLRMKAIDPLSAEELYYMIVLGENDIYTSSYKYSFARLLQRMGSKPRGDSLLMNVI